jgi:hypothetical protein
LNPNIVVLTERPWIYSGTSTEPPLLSSFPRVVRQISDVSSHTEIRSAGAFARARYRVSKPFHVDHVAPGAGSFGFTGYAPVVRVAGPPTNAAPAAETLVAAGEAIPDQAAQARARALTILRSWLEPHESDDQATAFRQLKEELNAGRRGQRKLYPD